MQLKKPVPNFIVQSSSHFALDAMCKDDGLRLPEQKHRQIQEDYPNQAPSPEA